MQEIEVFRLTIQGYGLNERVLSLMDRQIPYHILFLLGRPDGHARLGVIYKEASQSGSNTFHLRQSYHTQCSKPEELFLNLTTLDMDALYESIVRQIAQLKAKMKKEKQLSRQMELRREIRRFENSNDR